MQIFQKFLELHPKNNDLFELYDAVEEAQDETAWINAQLDAMNMARELDIEHLEAISREAPLLAEEIKKYHLKWDDIFEFFPDNIIRDLMNSVELDLIAMSMKGMDEEVVTRVKNNLPQKKQAMYEPVEGAVSKLSLIHI